VVAGGEGGGLGQGHHHHHQGWSVRVWGEGAGWLWSGMREHGVVLCVGGGWVMGVVVFIGGWWVRERVAVVVELREALRRWSWLWGVGCIH
jgi:hypothetical protein